MSTAGLIDAVIFDLDGTLVDTLGDIAAATNHVLVGEGYPVHAIEAYRDFVGEGVRRLIEQALPMSRAGHSEALVARTLALFQHRYQANLVVKTAPYDGIRILLSRLEARAIPIAVLSNKPHALTQQVVRELFPKTAFEVVYGQRQGISRKPDPVAALEIAELLGIPPARCAFVGDTIVDVETAVAAAMIPIGVSWGYQKPARLMAKGAHQVITHPRALLDLL